MARGSTLYSEYLDLAPSLARLQRAMVEQLDHLVGACGLTLGVSIESRVKTWSSIAEKLERKRLEPKKLDEIEDLVGLRVIFLFQRDLELFHCHLGKTFNVVSAEDTSERLADAQFGYKSQHYILSLPAEWDRIPSLNGLTLQKVEVQVRTLAQHIWATASHKLQYKHEESVPLPLRRSIYRVSALLETVDLEFTRVLEQRDEYVKKQAVQASAEDGLDVNVIESVLDEILPAKNKDAGAEDYSELLVDLQHFNIGTRGALASLLSTHKSAILSADAQEVRRRSGSRHADNSEAGERLTKRLAQGIFFKHIGLVRAALSEQFGNTTVQAWLVSKKGDT